MANLATTELFIVFRRHADFLQYSIKLQEARRLQKPNLAPIFKHHFQAVCLFLRAFNEQYLVKLEYYTWRIVVIAKFALPLFFYTKIQPIPRQEVDFAPLFDSSLVPKYKLMQFNG